MYSEQSVAQRYVNFCDFFPSQPTSEPKLAYISVQCKPNNFYFCLDTGSSASFIRKSVWTQMTSVIDKNRIITYTVADGSTHTTLGVTIIRINFPNQRFSIDCEMHVVDNLPTNALVGLNVLKSFFLNFAKAKLEHSKGYFLKIHFLNPCVNNNDFKQCGNNLVLKNQEHYANFISPVLLDTTSYKIYPIEADGQIKLNFMEKPAELNGPIFDLANSELACTLFETLDISDEYTDVKCTIPDIDVNPSLTKELSGRYFKLLEEFKDLFIYRIEDIGQYSGPEKFEINLTTNRPQRGNTYSIPIHLREKFQDQIKLLLDHNLIEKCDSIAYNHGMLPVSKKDKTIRWVSDCRLLNSVTEDESNTLPKIADLLERMIGNEVYSQCDVYWCFHQFEIHEDSRNFCAFMCPITNQRYRWRNCFFGLKNIPSHVSFLMNNRVFQDTDPNQLSVYIDDITGYNKNHTSHLVNLRDMFMRMRFFNLKFKTSKCKFGYPSVNQFGYSISKSGLQVDPKRVQKLLDIEKPVNKRQLHTFMGSSGYYRSNIMNYAKYSSELTPMLASDKPFEWSTVTTDAWFGLLSAIKQCITISKPNLDEQIIVTSDASINFHGGTISQEIDGTQKLLGVHSEHFPKTMINWAIHIKELAGCVRIIEKFNDLLIGKTFLLRTDSTWVFHLLTNANRIYFQKSGPVVRLLLRLSQYNFKLQHMRGTNDSFSFADTMSRLNKEKFELSHRTVGELIKPFNGDTHVVYFNIPKIYSRSEIRANVIKSQIASKDDLIENYSMYKTFDPKTLLWDDKIVVPAKFVPEVLRQIHNHNGIRRELGYLRNCEIKWKHMTQDLIDFNKSCSQCSRLRTARNTLDPEVFPRGPLTPFQSVGIDILQIGAPGSAHFVLGLICHFSGYVILQEVKSTSLVDCLDILLGWILQHNITEATLQSDNQFNKKEVIEQLNLVNIFARFGCPYNSRSNSKIERTFRTVGERVRLFGLADNGLNDLNIILQFVAAQINATPIGVSQISPYEVIYGYTPRQFLIEELKPITYNNLQSYARKHYHRLRLLSNNIEAHYNRDAAQRTVHTNNRLYLAGDKVRIIKPQARGANKFTHLKYSKEVYTIIEVRPSTRSYLLELISINRRPLRILAHHRRVKKVFSRYDKFKDVQTPAPLIDEQVEIPISENIEAEPTTSNTSTVTRAGRTVKRPSYLLHFES